MLCTYVTICVCKCICKCKRVSIRICICACVYVYADLDLARHGSSSPHGSDMRPESLVAFSRLAALAMQSYKLQLRSQT